MSATKFFSTLYAHQSGVLELRTFGPDGDSTKAKTLRRKANALRDFVLVENGIVDEPKVLSFIKGCNAAHLGAFYGVALRARESLKDRKGDAAHCQTLTTLFVDADFKHLGEEETIRRINAAPLAPSMVVESGGGLHPYWILDSSSAFYLKRELPAAKLWLRHIAASAAGVVDESVSEPARVLRIPGSYNFKYDPPRLVTLSLHTDQVYALSDIQKAWGKPDTLKSSETSESETFVIPETIPQGDRHTLLYRFLRSQKARAVPLDVALVGCHALNEQQCQPPIARKELDDYLRRVWDQTDSPDFDGQKKGDFLRHPETHKILAKNQTNIKRALKKLGVTLRYNEFSKKTLVTYGEYSGPYEDPQRNRIWLHIDSKFHFQIPEGYFDMFMLDHAYRNPVHPVRDYFDGLVWDKVKRVDEWLIAYARAGDGAYTRAVSALMLLSAVRRIYQPGVKFDEMVVLESEQGKGKSSLLLALCHDKTWFSDDLPLNVDAKQIIERTQGKWIIEAAELSGMHSSKVEHLKSMMSRQVDGPVRMAYAHLPCEQRRQFVLVGTTNAHAYLDDSTGNRRFWPVYHEEVDLEALARDKDQLWAEAVVRHKAGESIRLSPELYTQAAIQQERRRSVDPWEPLLESNFTEDYTRVAPQEIWKVLGIPVDRQDARMAKRVAAIMQRLGYRRMSMRDPDDAARVVKGWGKGEARLPYKEDKKEEM